MHIGLDVGINSLGYAVIKDAQLLEANSHIFEVAENPKNGDSLAAPRREKRALRRVIRRRGYRLHQIRMLFDMPQIQPDQHFDESPWALRAAGLKHPLNKEEWARVLLHIAKRRGFQSSRKNADHVNDIEGKKLLEGTKKLEEAWVSGNVTTIGAYFALKHHQNEKIRNGNGQYDHTPLRKFLGQEVDTLFETQRGLGNPLANKDIQEKYKKIAFYQRPLQSSAKLVGMCTHEPSEKRAPKNSFSGEQFVLYSRLRALKLLDGQEGDRNLTVEEEQKILEHTFTHEKTTFGQVRKLLNIPESARFNLVSYRQTKKEKSDWESLRKSSEDKPLAKLTGVRALYAITQRNPFEDPAAADVFDKIAWLLTTEKDDAKIRAGLEKLGLAHDVMEDCLKQADNFTGHVSLSCKAIKKILPGMQTGMSYDDAVKNAGYVFNKSLVRGDKLKLPALKDVANPIVARAVAQARKILNAIITKYPHEPIESIRIELARDLAKNFKERKDLEREMKNNAERRERQASEIATLFGRQPSGEEMLKYRLWQEQQQRCAYSDTPITVEHLKDARLTQIDHILPYSRSFDDSYMNKVLCFTAENQQKGNSTPHEQWGSGEHWQTLLTFAERLPKPKRDRFLMENYEAREGDWKARHLTDTRYIGRILKQHIEQHLAFPPHVNKPVHVTNGRITAHLRRLWGLDSFKKREADDKHHALDAIVIACTTDAMVQKMSAWNRYQRSSGGEKLYFEKPWPTFREDVEAKLNSLFVSRQPSRKVTGAAHEETIRSDRRAQGLGVVETKPITGINLKNLDRMVEKDVRNKKLYAILKQRLQDHNDKPEVAFAEPSFHEYLKANWSEKAPRITSLKLNTSEASGIPINGGLASNGEMKRVDVFTKPNKKGKLEYYLCPVYVADFVRGQLPNKVMVSGKKEHEWLELDDSFTFLFQLYKNDLVKIIKGDGSIVEGYYNGADRATNSINLLHHDGSKLHRSIGVKTLATFEKYSVDYFGHRTLIKKENRHELAHRRRRAKSPPVAQK
jgi:CRISPR-associated endonuclease Csn1